MTVTTPDATMMDMAAERERGARRRRHAALALRLGALAMFAIIMLYFAFTTRGFASPFNIANVIEQTSIMGILAFGMAVVLIGGGTEVQTGGIDLSIAANAGLCAAVLATLLAGGTDQWVAFAATFGTGMAIGALNALAVVRFHILALLATLAVMNIAAGLELTVTQNSVIAATSPVLSIIGLGRFMGLSALAWIFILFTLILAWVIHYSPLGNRLYAVGGTAKRREPPGSRSAPTSPAPISSRASAQLLRRFCWWRGSMPRPRRRGSFCWPFSQPRCWARCSRVGLCRRSAGRCCRCCFSAFWPMGSSCRT